jgi:pimeloyl-ACP methyl ester carboxylesterase
MAVCITPPNVETIAITPHQGYIPMNTIMSSRGTITPPASTQRFSRIVRWIGRAFLGLLALFIGLAVIGASYEAIMAAGDATRYPPAGQMVDVGGYRLHLHCVGEGSPTVILEAGGGGNVLHWMLVQPAIAQSTRVCAYDRAGLGWSEPGPLPRTPQRIVRELHTLLTNARIPGPYILVGHSIGGKYVRLYSSQYPQDVAGLVLVDARHEDVDTAMTPTMRADDRSNVQMQQRIYWSLGRLGVMRLMPPSLAGIDADTRTKLAVMASNSKRLSTQWDEYTVWADADPALRGAPTLGRLPLIVLSSELMAERDPILRAAMRTQAGLSSNSQLVIATSSGHGIQIDQPTFVIDAVQQVIRAARTGQPVGK